MEKCYTRETLNKQTEERKHKHANDLEKGEGEN